MTSSPSYPFEQVVADYFSLNGHNYLFYADRYSGWISIVKLSVGESNSKFLKLSSFYKGNIGLRPTLPMGNVGGAPVELL